MNENYRTFFGLSKEPFGTDIALKDILKTDQLVDVKNRFDYVLRLGAIGLVTGEVGSGKSTAIRYAQGNLHPSEYRSIYVTASSGSIMELYRQLLNKLDIYRSSNSKTLAFPQKSRHCQAQNLKFCFSYSTGVRYPIVECFLSRL